MNAILNNADINLKKSKIQASAIKAIMSGFKKSRRGKCIMACGTGKTRVAFGVVAKRKDVITIICVPSLGLVSQFIKDCKQHAPNHRVLPVCSEMQGESPEDYDIADATTFPDDIAAAMKKANARRPLLIVSTYQSYDKVCDASKLSGKNAGLLVADEAHNTAGQRGKAMSLCLYDCNMQVSCRLFLTATPRLYTGKKEGTASMDDAELYGPEFFQLSFAKALEHEIVSDYEIHIVDVLSEDSLKKIRQASNHAELADVTASHLAGELQKETHGRCFVFHNRLSSSKEFSEFLRAKGVHSVFISGKDSVKKREKILKEFEQYNGSSVICSVRVFGEGIDSPSVSRIVIADPMTSTIQIAQAIGRGTRAEPGKEKLIIHVPVFLGPQEGPDAARISEFGSAIAVLKAMKQIDESLVSKICVPSLGGNDGSKRRGAGHGGQIVDPMWKKLLTNVPMDVLQSRVFRMVDISWEIRGSMIRSAMEKYFEKHGKYPKSNTKGELFNLTGMFSSWATAHSYCYKHSGIGGLSEVEAHFFGNLPSKLASIDWNKIRPVMERDIRKFKANHGRYPSSKTVGFGPSLYFKDWVSFSNYLKNHTEFIGISRFIASFDESFSLKTPRTWINFQPVLIESIKQYVIENGKYPTTNSIGKVDKLSWGGVSSFCASKSPYGSLSKTIDALFPESIEIRRKQRAAGIVIHWDDFVKLLTNSLTKFFKKHKRFPVTKDLDMCGLSQSKWRVVDALLRRRSPHGNLSRTIKALFPYGKPEPN